MVAYGNFDDDLDADSSGEMDDYIGIVDHSAVAGIFDVIEVVGEALEDFEVADVFHAAGERLSIWATGVPR